MGNNNFILKIAPIFLLASSAMYAQQKKDTTNNEKKIEEVVVVAYGTQKKVNLTGAVGNIASKRIDDRPITSSINALQGLVPGLTIVTNNGQPGKDAGAIRVRGIGTLNNSNPMIVVDGVIASISEVNPNDIESISVLKDAASAAIYGSRAANGVILVTTKRGKKGSIRVQYDTYLGVQNVSRLPEYLPSWQQATLFNEARRNEGQSAFWSDTDIEKFKNQTDPLRANTDWLKLLYSQAGFQQNHYVGVSGGSDKTNYMFSAGYFDQQGNVKDTNYRKYTSRFNINSQVTDKVNLYANLGIQLNQFNEPVATYGGDFSQIIRMANRISRTIPLKYPNGHYASVADGNPIAWLDLGSFNKTDNNIITGNLGGDFQLVKGLKFRPSFNYRLGYYNGKKFIKDIQFYNANGAPLRYQGPNKLSVDYSKNVYYNLTALLDYQTTFGENHNIQVLAGASKEYNINSYLYGYREKFLNNQLTELNVAPIEGQQNNGSSSDWALESIFGRFNYDFNNKYLFEATVRRDGSSRFVGRNKWSTFPSASVGWVVSSEGFFEPIKSTVNFLKLRASWGKLGNQQVGDYPTYATIAAGEFYPFNQTLLTGIAPNNGSNENLTWEATTTKNIGADFAFLDKKLDFSVDYFDRLTSDILLQLPVGAVYGLDTPFQNAGSVSNKGWEFVANYRTSYKDFKFDVSANFSYIENKITDLKGSGPYISGNRIQDVGLPINSLYGFVADGIFKTQAEVDAYAKYNIGGRIGPGDIKYKDLNGDGVIDANDRTYLGTYFPKITYGLNLNTSWKNIELSLFFQGVAGVKAMGGNLIGKIGQSVDNATSVFWDRWTPDNPNAEFPRAWASYTQNDPNVTPSSFWAKDASYLRLKSLILAFNLPTAVLEQIGLKKAKIFYSGQNLLTFTKFYDWMDPELGSTGSIYSYPQVVTHSVGVSVTF